MTTTTKDVVVQKYGGSSVADLERIGLVADRIVATKRAGQMPVVVVSAMGKTTNALVEQATAVARAGGPHFDAPRRELDMLVSTGERVSMALLSIAIQARGEAAVSFTGSQSGIITDEAHFDARILEVRPARILEALALDQIVIVAGFQGMSVAREITTLGRGGSDTTAVALAAALQAKTCEIYSDVDGIYSADPHIHPNAVHWSSVPLEDLAELARAGAKVICEQAIDWARRSGITIVARDAKGTSGRESRIATSMLGDVWAVATQPSIGWAVGAKPADVLPPDVRIGEQFFLGHQAAAWWSIRELPDWPALRASWRSPATVVDDCALVSVVGYEVLGRNACAALLGALREAGVEPSAYWSGARRVSFMVGQGQAGAAERALHVCMMAGSAR